MTRKNVLLLGKGEVKTPNPGIRSYRIPEPRNPHEDILAIPYLNTRSMNGKL